MDGAGGEECVVGTGGVDRDRCSLQGVVGCSEGDLLFCERGTAVGFTPPSVGHLDIAVLGRAVAPREAVPVLGESAHIPLCLPPGYHLAFQLDQPLSVSFLDSHFDLETVLEAVSLSMGKLDSSHPPPRF